MKTVLLHIGTSKTGTKSIQEALARARESGTIRPVCYPMPRGDRNNSALATLYLPYERMPRFVRSTYLTRSAELEKMRHRYRRALFDELRTERNGAAPRSVSVNPSTTTA